MHRDGLNANSTVPADISRRTFVRRAVSALGAALAGATLGPFGVRTTVAEAAGTQWITVPNGQWVLCTNSVCHDSSSCSTHLPCSLNQREEWAHYKNLSGSSKTCWGNPPSGAPCAHYQCDGGAKWWFTWVGWDWCCGCQ